ncbi:hypothetical protein [Kineosporia babensis]|uniref:Uncharacterized protein n=1 Tax=Kineosporia babensis TaxID=499548 RepID=A0A9X1NKU7_9ACTN|nr:hypothetical protein [Kineosporia babensis]MCD5316802.1 hypothetical protein [Kineosporia babensis]
MTVSTIRVAAPDSPVASWAGSSAAVRAGFATAGWWFAGEGGLSVLPRTLAG